MPAPEDLDVAPAGAAEEVEDGAGRDRAEDAAESSRLRADRGVSDAVVGLPVVGEVVRDLRPADVSGEDLLGEEDRAGGLRALAGEAERIEPVLERKELERPEARRQVRRGVREGAVLD